MSSKLKFLLPQDLSKNLETSHF